MKKVGLVFSGGGGKGAYEIGVWKALREFNIDSQISTVSGTSVGALNGMLFASSMYDTAEQIWTNITPEQVLHVDVFGLLRKFAQERQTKISLASCLAKRGYVAESIMTMFFVQRDGIFSQENLKRLIEHNVDVGRLRQGIPLYCCATDIAACTAKYACLSDCSDEECIRDFLLASAALPVVFDAVTINGVSYYDGGIIDNTPIRPLVERENVDTVIVVMLENDGSYMQDDQKFEDINIIRIVPSGELGGLSDGTLKFSAEKSRELIDMGYNDAKAIFEKIQDFLVSERQYRAVAEDYGQQAQSAKKIILDQRNIEKLLDGQPLPDDNAILAITDSNTENHELVQSSVILKRIDDYESDSEEIEQYKQVLAQSLSEGEQAILDENIDALIDEMKKNSHDIEVLAVESITALASTKGRVRNLHTQGFWKRLWNNVTGKNQKMVADILSNHGKAIAANTSLIQKLSQRSVLTMDALVAMGNKLNYMMLNVSNLHIQNHETRKMLDRLRQAVHVAFDNIERKLDYTHQRINQLESGQQLLLWRNSVRSKYGNKNISDQVFDMIHDYLQLTNGRCYNDEVHFFRSAVMEVIGDKQLISRQRFVKDVLDDNKKILYLRSLTDSHSQHIPWLIKDAHNVLVFRNVDQVIAQYDEADELPAVDLATELLFELKQPISLQTQSQEIKAYFTEKIEQFEKIIIGNSFYDRFLSDVKNIKNAISNFKLKVALLGSNKENVKQVEDTVRDNKNEYLDISVVEHSELSEWLSDETVIAFWVVSRIDFVFDSFAHNVITMLQEHDKQCLFVITHAYNKPDDIRKQIVTEVMSHFPALRIVSIDVHHRDVEPLVLSIDEYFRQYDELLHNYVSTAIDTVKSDVLNALKGHIKKLKAMEEDVASWEGDSNRIRAFKV